MPHHLVQPHMAIYDMIRSGTARTSATIAAALAAIGSTPTRLVWTFAGDGVYTLSANLTTPVNVVNEFPPGVTVNKNGFTFTINGGVMGVGTWDTGAGTTVYATSGQPATEITNIKCRQFRLSSLATGFVFSVDDGSGPGAAVHLYNDQGGDACGISMSRSDSNNTLTYQNFVKIGGSMHWARPGGNSQMIRADIGLGLGSSTVAAGSPAHTLHMFVDDAFKATASWSTTSDARAKTIQGPYTLGVAHLKALPAPVRFVYNGKAGMVADGVEHVSMIAQDVNPVDPEMISTYEDYLEADDAEKTTIYALNTSRFIYILRNAIVELDARLESIENAATGRLPRLEAIAHTHGGSGNAGVVQAYTPLAEEPS